MKTATAFLVAVTVFTSLFLESSTAPNPFLGRFTSNLGKASRSVGGVVSGAGKLVDGVIVDVGQTVGGVVSRTGKLVSGVVDDVDTLVTSVFEVVTQAVDKIVKEVTGLLGGLLGTVETIESELGEKLKKALIKAKRALEEVTELAKNTVEAAAEGANDTVKELDGHLKKSVEKLIARLAAVTDIGKEISEKAGDDASVVVNEVEAVVAEVIELVKNILRNVAEAAKSKTTKAVDGSEQLRLPERITSSNEALGQMNKIVKKAMDADTGDYKDGLTEVYQWLTEEFEQLVAKTHSKLEQVVQGTSEDRKAMASELIKLIEQTIEQVHSFRNIPEAVKKALKENILIKIVGNARVVYDKFSKA